MVGPSICAAHPWTIWRSEADYLYFALTGNEEYKKLAWNGFVTNFSKIDKSGRTYATYTPDLITGGGFAARADDVLFEIAKGIPKSAKTIVVIGNENLWCNITL